MSSAPAHLEPLIFHWTFHKRWQTACPAVFPAMPLSDSALVNFLANPAVQRSEPFLGWQMFALGFQDTTSTLCGIQYSVATKQPSPPPNIAMYLRYWIRSDFYDYRGNDGEVSPPASMPKLPVACSFTSISYTRAVQFTLAISSNADDPILASAAVPTAAIANLPGIRELKEWAPTDGLVEGSYATIIINCTTELICTHSSIERAGQRCSVRLSTSGRREACTSAVACQLHSLVRSL